MLDTLYKLTLPPKRFPNDFGAPPSNWMGLAVELQAWEDMLETWPDVAQKLRPSPLEMEVTEVPSLEAGSCF